MGCLISTVYQYVIKNDQDKHVGKNVENFESSMIENLLRHFSVQRALLRTCNAFDTS